MKICTLCKESKPLADFYNQKGRPEGKHSYCRTCSSAASKRNWANRSPEQKVRDRATRGARSIQFRANQSPEQRAASLAAAKAYRLANPDRLLHNQLWNAYGITLAYFKERLARQEGRCACCLSFPPPGKRLYVDHNHQTSGVRGLLCPHCNSMLGHSRENPAILRAGAVYLEKFGG